jgi:hydroxymethylpyrimidine/phosphomethylpyrimidine kinase
VLGVHPVPAEFVTLQIEAIVADIGCDAVKTGMLATAAIVEAVGAAVEAMDLPHLVVDPVMIAKGGDRLLDADAVHAVRATLLRLARVVTPNIPEAETLAEMTIRSVADMHEAGQRIQQLGCEYVVVKGGHLEADESTDVLIGPHIAVEFAAPRLATRHTHGTGCTFAAAVASQLALGESVETAVRAAKHYVTEAMRRGIVAGAGHQPLDHFWQTR